MIEGMLEVKFRNQVFNLRTTFRIIEINRGSIRSREMTDNMHGIDKSIGWFCRFFNIELDVKRRKKSLNFRFKSFNDIMTLIMSMRIIFAIIVEEEVNHFGVNTRFAETIIFTIFLRDINKLLI